MVVVQITTDNREPFREYHKATPWFGTAPTALLEGFARLPETQVHVIGCTQLPMAGSPEKLAPNIWFHSLLVPKFGWLRTGYLGCIHAVRRKVRELKPDIVHGQGTERECSISAVFSGVPNVLTIHGNMREVERINHPKPFTYGWLAARLESFTIPRSAGVVCITRYTQRAVSGLARKTWVVPNAVDPSFFEVVCSPEEPPVVLCVANICARKNQNAFIRALDPLAERRKFQVIFLSGPTSDDYVHEFFDLLKTRPWCQFGGWADREKLKEQFARAALLVLPSLEDNCPMTVLEAMAAGVPVMAANVGGVPDLIDPGRTGLLCDPHDAESMRTGTEQLLSDATLRTRLAAEARDEARRRFRPLAIAARHVEIYQEVLNRFEPASRRR